MEERENLRSEQWALTWVLQELLKQREKQRIVREEIAKQLRDGKLTKNYALEMLRALSEARELARRTEQEVIGILEEIRKEQQDGRAEDHFGDAGQHFGS